MLLLIVTLTLYFNGNEITTHLIHNQIYNKFRNINFAWKQFTTIMSCKQNYRNSERLTILQANN